MSKLKKSDIESLSKDDLKSKINELRVEIMKDNSQVASGTIPKSPGRLRDNKKNIARIMTLLNMKTEEKKKDE